MYTHKKFYPPPNRENLHGKTEAPERTTTFGNSRKDKDPTEMFCWAFGVWKSATSYNH